MTEQKNQTENELKTSFLSKKENSIRKTNRAELTCAMKREISSRVPYTYNALPETDVRLKSYLGLGEEASVEEYFDCNKIHDFWEALGQRYSLPEREKRLRTEDQSVKIDIWGVKRKLITAVDAHYYEVIEVPLDHSRTIADIDSYDWPKPEEVEFPDLPSDFNINQWHDSYFTRCMNIGPYGIARSMFGMEKYFMDMVLQPELIEAAVAKVEEFTLQCCRIMLEKYKGMIDLIGTGDDYGAQQGLLFSVEQSEKFFMPSLKRHFDLCKQHDVGCYVHSCGAVFDMIPSFIEVGTNVLNPIQTSAHNMDPAIIKKEFGKYLTFHGGLDIQQVLLKGTPEQVKEEVRYLIDTLGPEGYILESSHRMQIDIPLENMVAFYEEARKYSNMLR